MIDKITRHIFTEKINGRVYKAGGSAAHKFKPHQRRYEMLGGIFGGGYKPKHKELRLETIDVKDQYPYNTCSWNAYAVIRQITEKTRLSVRSIVAYGKLKGLLSGDGFSTLAHNSEVGKDFGVADESLVPDDKKNNFDEYASPTVLTAEVKASAAKHKPDYRKKFFVRTVAEYVKALDDGHGIEVGYDWYSSYNMNGGLTAPWILLWTKGVRVGGHATDVVGYKNLVLDDNGNVVDGLAISQNSYGADWGDEGDFYVKFSDLVKSGVTGMVEVDLTEENIIEMIKSFEGKFVKGIEPGIFAVKDGQKRPFLDKLTFLSFGGRTGINRNWVTIQQSTLDAIPLGAPMDIKDSEIWPFIENNWDTIRVLAEPANIQKVSEIIKDKQEINNYYKQGFKVTFWESLKSMIFKI